jgi:hypothetical protein
MQHGSCDGVILRLVDGKMGPWSTKDSARYMTSRANHRIQQELLQGMTAIIKAEEGNVVRFQSWMR